MMGIVVEDKLKMPAVKSTFSSGLRDVQPEELYDRMTY